MSEMRDGSDPGHWLERDHWDERIALGNGWFRGTPFVYRTPMHWAVAQVTWHRMSTGQKGGTIDRRYRKTLEAARELAGRLSEVEVRR